MILKTTGSQFTVDSANTDEAESLHLEETIKTIRLGGGGVLWPGGSASTYSRMIFHIPPGESIIPGWCYCHAGKIQQLSASERSMKAVRDHGQDQ